jgi:hypothetical protein
VLGKRPVLAAVSAAVNRLLNGQMQLVSIGSNHQWPSVDL